MGKGETLRPDLLPSKNVTDCIYPTPNNKCGYHDIMEYDGIGESQVSGEFSNKNHLPPTISPFRALRFATSKVFLPQKEAESRAGLERAVVPTPTSAPDLSPEYLISGLRNLSCLVVTGT